MHPDESQAWFARARDTLESAYLAHHEPWKQSGFSGLQSRWMALRKPIADCIDRAGTFLDIGCASGYLMECCSDWTARRNIGIEPYGMDISPRLIALAQARLPRWKERFWTANAFDWIPPRRFDFVRTELAYVPADYERPYLEHLLAHYLAPQGRLLVANYNEDEPDPARGLFPGAHPTRHILERLKELGFAAKGHKDAFDPAKGRKTRIAILSPKS